MARIPDFGSGDVGSSPAVRANFWDFLIKYLF